MMRADDWPVQPLILAPADTAAHELDVVIEVEKIIAQCLPKSSAFDEAQSPDIYGLGADASDSWNRRGRRSLFRHLS